jgi:Raf kinase inhibitor-like YbhB/YbcL family protein
MIVVSAIMVGLSGCSDSTPSASASAAPTITVTSPAFSDGDAIPADHSCDGAGTAPPLVWRGVPTKARELAVVVDDPDAPGGTYTHWVVLRINVDTTTIGEGSRPAGSVEVPNSSGEPGYAPLCPPSGSHHYRFTVYALSAPTDRDDHSLGRALSDITAHTIAWGRLTGTYRR